MIIDNFDKARKYVKFDKDNDPDLFYYVQIIQRKKDKSVTISKNSKTIREYFITSKKFWYDHVDEIKLLCRTFHARAYMHLVPRSWKKCTLMAIEELATYLRSDQCSSLRKLTAEMAGKYPADKQQKLWVVDIDTKDTTFLRTVDNVITHHCQPNNDKIIDTFPTRNGYHLITRPFNLQEFRAFFSEEEVSVHKNNPTLLYFESED